MKINISNKISAEQKTATVVFLSDKGLPSEFKTLDKSLGGEVSGVLAQQEFKGKLMETLYLPAVEKSQKPILLVGLGQTNDVRLISQAVGSAAKILQSKKIDKYSFYLPDSFWKKGGEVLLKNLLIAVCRATYQFNDYLSDKEAHLTLPTEIDIYTPTSAKIKSAQRVVEESLVIARAITFARKLGNLPPIDMTPTYLANEALQLAKANPKVKIKVLDRAGIVKEKMGALAAVASGSLEEPRFIVLEYFNASKSKGTYVFAGKAVTFDSGGISIKPADKMDEMKFDMMGGAAVLAAMKAVAELKLKINLVVLIPATENMPGHRAYRPGDIVTARNGKTIEILNTDAEGRLILADALSYASDYKPKAVIDLATLTGACIVALGTNMAGLFSRDEKLTKQILDSSLPTNDQLWRLPLNDDFKNDMKSKVADILNAHPVRWGGASKGAAFLEYFTDYPWAHLDIAGPMAFDETSYSHTGASGYGVQLLVELAKKWAK